MMAAAPTRVETRVEDGRLRFSRGPVNVLLHPLWLRERSILLGAIDPTNGQRLIEPLDIALDIAVTDCVVVDGACGGSFLDVGFDDGMRAHVAVAEVLDERAAESPPAGRAWLGADTTVPMVDYRALVAPRTADATMLTALHAFFELGFFVVHDTPTEPGSLHEIASRFGRVSATNFGALFDVRTEPLPIDLAYTPMALSAHTDQPYRRPTPGIQLLHTLVNGAPGGASTIVDGLAAVDALAATDPEGHEMLCSFPVEFRYDIGCDVKTGRAPIIDRRLDGTLRQIRFSPRLDHAPVADPDVLDVYYRGRRRLATLLNDPHRQLGYRMEAGDVLVVDNHRVLHGRTAFDPTRGSRHLQGCYIDHDGPETEWVLANRRIALTGVTR